MKNKLKTITRLLLLVATIGLVIVLFTPIWRIELNAPQYPEGLALTIHANGLKGNVDIINGLNHYIGMKTLHNEDFFEFTILPYLIIFFAIGFLIVAIVNKRKWLNILLVLFIGFGVIAMVDFWRWEYNYGHHLNPDAAIIVPGMAYQPPLIGFKQLLNFGAYSIPDIGGWIFIGAGLLLVLCVIIEWKKLRSLNNQSVTGKGIAVLTVCFLLSSCQTGPEPIKTGSDNCSFCKMTIADAKYGAELITKKGKAYKFDDLHCIKSFLKTDNIKETGIQDIYLVDFAGSHSLIKKTESFLLQSDDIHAPMNGKVISFQNKDSMQAIASKIKAIELTWDQFVK
ncbi:MAG: nitrous oxide reductase accessory protein NosL [Ferruginibacter sp.]